MNAIILTTKELINHTKGFKWSRKIKQLHIHHTYKPGHSDYNGRNGVDLQNAIRDYHVYNRGWSDIEQHATLLPDGRWVTGRDFNKNPDSITGWNEGAFCIEMLGNFDIGHDRFEGAQAAAMFEFCAFFVLDRGIDAGMGVKFHRDNPTALKTCPGTSINREEFIKELFSSVNHMKKTYW